MRANPGGNVSPEHVIGRDSFIAALWRTLDQLGVVLVAERRMGKTSILKKMQAEAPADTLVLFTDVEGVCRVLELVELLLREVGDHLSTAIKVTGWFKRLRSGLSGTEIGGVLKLPQSAAPPWKTHLEQLLGDLAENQQRRVILIWDELPWMLQKIAREEGQAAVVDLLDVLRSQRQKHANLRMVFAGSIGLHHITHELHEQGYAGSPLNDLRTLEVPPLDPPSAQALALALLRGEGLTTDRPDEVAATIARLAEGVPFYVHHVVAGLTERGEPATPALASEVVAEMLTGAQDPWHLEHFRERLPAYYGERAALVRAILDDLAAHSPLSLDELHERLETRFQPDNEVARRIIAGDREQLRTLVKQMQRDHYLRQEDNGAYTFRFEVLRRWWRLDLGLA